MAETHQFVTSTFITLRRSLLSHCIYGTSIFWSVPTMLESRPFLRHSEFLRLQCEGPGHDNPASFTDPGDPLSDMSSI